MLCLRRVLATCVALGVLSAIQLQAQKAIQNATCTNWKVFLANPTKYSSTAGGVNDKGTVVGSIAFNFNKPNSKAFVHFADGTLKFWRPTGSMNSGFSGRNNLGNTVGGFVDSSNIFHAVYLHGSTTTFIVHPNSAPHTTGLVGIDNLNTLLGSYLDTNRHPHIFKRRSNGQFISVPNFPGAKTTGAFGFSDNGVVVGGYTLPTDFSEVSHGFIYRNGSFATVNYGTGQAPGTVLVGISNQGLVVGDDYGNGFIYANGVIKNVVDPQGQTVLVRGISADGLITGDLSGGRNFTVRCQ